MTDLALGLSAPHHSTLPQSLPGPCLAPSRPTLPSSDLVPASALLGGNTSQVRHSVSFQLLQRLPDLCGSMAAVSSLEAVPAPRPAQAAVRWLCGDANSACPGASSALHLGWFPGSTSSQLGRLTSLDPGLLICTKGQPSNTERSPAPLEPLLDARCPGGGSTGSFHPQVRARQCPARGEPHAYFPLEPHLLPVWAEGHQKLYRDSYGATGHFQWGTDEKQRIGYM